MASKQQQKIKGNPASTRMQNERRKTRRHACWLRGQERKEARRQAQAARERANRERRENGEPTPWEAAKAARRQRRAQGVGAL